MPFYIYSFHPNKRIDVPGFDTYSEARNYMRQFLPDTIMDYYIKREEIEYLDVAVPFSFQSNQNDFVSSYINRITNVFRVPSSLLVDFNATTTSDTAQNNTIDSDVLTGLLTDFAKLKPQKELCLSVNICRLKMNLRLFREHGFFSVRRIDYNGNRLPMYDLWFGGRRVALLVVNVLHDDTYDDKISFSLI